MDDLSELSNQRQWNKSVVSSHSCCTVVSFKLLSAEALSFTFWFGLWYQLWPSWTTAPIHGAAGNWLICHKNPVRGTYMAAVGEKNLWAHGHCLVIGSHGDQMLNLADSEWELIWNIDILDQWRLAISRGDQQAVKALNMKMVPQSDIKPWELE